MPAIEVRRHTMRTPGGPHLDQSGVTLARLVGAPLGPFAMVVTSPVTRAYETALAMGFAVDRTDAHLGLIPDVVDHGVTWNAGFAEWARASHSEPSVLRYCADLHEWCAKVASSLPGDATALMISHGGVVEAIAVGCMRNANRDADPGEVHKWGGAIRYTEGVRLAFDTHTRQFTGCAVIRVAGAPPDR